MPTNPQDKCALKEQVCMDGLYLNLRDYEFVNIHDCFS